MDNWQQAWPAGGASVPTPYSATVDYTFSYRSGLKHDEVLEQLKQAGAKVAYGDQELRKFFTQVPRECMRQIESLEQRLGEKREP